MYIKRCLLFDKLPVFRNKSWPYYCTW